MIFDHFLEWNAVSIQSAICDSLKNWKVKTSLGFANSGESALIIEAQKEKAVLQVYLENEKNQITIKAGIAGKYLPEGKQVPKHYKVFLHTQIKEASKFFEEILEEYK